MQYVDWDRFEAEQGEAVEQGGGEQGGEEWERVSEYSRLRCLVLR